MNIIKIKKHQKGFTLLETLISIFILTLAITGPIYIASFSIRNTIDSRDNISAQYLAEEVVESIRNERDRRTLQGSTHWLSDSYSTIFGGVNCFNPTGLSVNKCVMKKNSSDYSYVYEACPSNGNCPNISFNASSSIIYGDKDVSATSKFIREFYIEKGFNDTSITDIPDREARIVVNIKWKSRGQNKIYTLKENLYAINYNLLNK